MDTARQIHDARGRVMLTPLNGAKDGARFWEGGADAEDGGVDGAKVDSGEAMRLESIQTRASATVGTEGGADPEVPTAVQTYATALKACGAPAEVAADVSHHVAVVLRAHMEYSALEAHPVPGLELLGFEDDDPLTWRLMINGSVVRFHRPEMYPMEPPMITMHVGESNERTALLPVFIADLNGSSELDPADKSKAWSPLWGDDITDLMRTLTALSSEGRTGGEEPSPRTLRAMKDAL